MIILNLYVFALAVLLAILEIQIEGKDGWAKNLPTWRPPKRSFVTRLYKRIMSERELTGYHVTLFTFVLLIFGFPFVNQLEFSPGNIAKFISYFLIFVVLWDFLWFVLNPYYPLSKFKKEHIWWHKKWALGAPADYYYGLLISFLVTFVAETWFGAQGTMAWWGENILFFIVETVILVLFTIYILDIDNWKSGSHVG